MPRSPDDSVPTRPSLLRRVKNLQDSASWQEFYDTYRRIVRGLALKSRLTDEEADDVVQDTFMEVSQKMPSFDYNAARGSFKAWLLQLVRWRIIDHHRKKARQRGSHFTPDPGVSRTEVMAMIPDPAALDFVTLWEDEWRTNLMQCAVERVRRSADAEKFQIFDLYLNKERPAEEVAAAFGITVDQVYVIKHRIAKMIEVEVRRLERELS